LDGGGYLFPLFLPAERPKCAGYQRMGWGELPEDPQGFAVLAGIEQAPRFVHQFVSEAVMFRIGRFLRQTALFRFDALVLGLLR